MVYNPFGFLSNHNTATAAAPAQSGSGLPSNAGNGATQQAAPAQSGAQIPFYKAAKWHHEIGKNYSALSLASAGQTFKPQVPAYGWMSRVDLRVAATGGADTGETVAFAEDAPWNAVSNVIFKNPSGRQLVSCTGFQAYLAAKYSAQGIFSLTGAPGFSEVAGASASGNYSFTLPIYQEFGQYGRGCLPNTNQAATYTAEYTFGTNSQIYTTPPDTPPTISGYIGLLARLAPAATDLYGRSQMQAPPLAGMYQEISVQTAAVVNGHNTFFSNRVGNVIRLLLLVWRDDAGSRSGAVSDGTYPSDTSNVRVTWDTTVLYDTTPVILRDLTWQRTGLAADTAVIALLFTDDEDHLATGEDGGQYIPTLGSTKLEIEWDSTASGGSFELVTVDIVSPDGGVGVTQ